MKFKIKYQINITIDEVDRITPPQKPDLLKKNRLLGDICEISGDPEKLKKEFNKVIENLCKQLEEWYYGPEED